MYIKYDEKLYKLINNTNLKYKNYNRNFIFYKKRKMIIPNEILNE